MRFFCRILANKTPFICDIYCYSFDEKYLVGFYSDKYDVSRETFKSKTQGMIRRLIRDSFFKEAEVADIPVVVLDSRRV